MTTTMYFGTTEKMQNVKCALSELPLNSAGFSNVIPLRNGGADVVRSWAHHKELDLSWSGTMDDIGVFFDYANGFYGTGLLYLTVPSADRRNLFSPNWAAPKLIANDWPEIYDTDGTPSATATNSYNQPTISMTYTTTAVVPTKKFFIPIPADKTLRLGWSGSKTSSGAVYYRPVNADGTPGTPVALTALSPTASTRLNASVAGSTCIGVEVYLYGAGTVTIASLMAQLWPTAITPPLTGNFQPGRGYSGFKFEDTPSMSIIQDTDSTNGSLEVMNMNATLIEVGLWQ